MTADIELLPLPEYLYGREASDNERVVTVADAHAYAVRNVAHHTAAKDAEIEALRAEREVIVAEAVKYAGKSGRLEAKVERLAEALRRAEGLLRSAGIIAESDLERPHSIATEIKNALRDHDQEGPMTDDLPLRLRKAAHIEPEEVAELMEEAAAALEAAREDAERLDWLDTQRSDDVQGSYPDEPQLVWHYWDIDSPDCTDVRDAIDQARGKGGAGK